MFGQQKVLLQMWQVRVLSYMGLIYQIFMPKNFSFSFQTLKTRHFGDVSATEVFVAYVARVRVLTLYGPHQIIPPKNSHFRSKLWKHATFVMFQQQKVLLHMWQV